MTDEQIDVVLSRAAKPIIEGLAPMAPHERIAVLASLLLSLIDYQNGPERPIAIMAAVEPVRELAAGAIGFMRVAHLFDKKSFRQPGGERRES